MSDSPQCNKTCGSTVSFDMRYLSYYWPCITKPSFPGLSSIENIWDYSQAVCTAVILINVALFAISELSGLRNQGNSCYFNSEVQLLRSTATGLCKY